jgi:Ser/Thr protein kinase RdoA (MazF antagonist)
MGVGLQDAVHVPVRHSVLDPDALAERILPAYGLGEPVRCRFFRRSMSDAYRVEAPAGSFFFKVGMYGRHDRAAVEAEVAFLRALGEHKIPVALPVPRRDGAYIADIAAPEGTRYGVLYRAAEGEAPQETNLAHSCAFGHLVARIHRCADESDRRYERWHLDETHLIRDPIRYMMPYVQHRPADLDYLRRFGEDLIAELRALLPTDLPQYGVCHGDLHTGNARVNSAGEMVLYDFDSFGYGWRALDIGVYRVSYDWMDLSPECKAAKARFWEAFVEGYVEERALSRDELAAVELALPIRHLELMGMTIRYWALHQGTHWINDAYFDQHVAWCKEWAGTYRQY